MGAPRALRLQWRVEDVSTSFVQPKNVSNPLIDRVRRASVTPMSHSLGTRVGVVLTATVSVATPVVALSASPAEAGGPQYPAGCTANGYQGWQGFCWAGQSYVNTGTYVRGVQHVLTGFFHYSGPIDSVFGSGTASATAAYQSSNGLTPDGIVGGSTWGSMQTAQQNWCYLGSFNGYKRYGRGFDTSGQYFAYWAAGNQRWLLYDNGVPLGYMNA